MQYLLRHHGVPGRVHAHVLREGLGRCRVRPGKTKGRVACLLEERAVGSLGVAGQQLVDQRPGVRECRQGTCGQR